MSAASALSIAMGCSRAAEAKRVMQHLSDAGYVLVPRHATPQMIEAGWASSHDENAQATWNDMVESALLTDAAEAANEIA